LKLLCNWRADVDEYSTLRVLFEGDWFSWDALFLGHPTHLIDGVKELRINLLLGWSSRLFFL